MRRHAVAEVALDSYRSYEGQAESWTTAVGKGGKRNRGLPQWGRGQAILHLPKLRRVASEVSGANFARPRWKRRSRDFVGITNLERYL
jgi:hypothetical protein